MRAAPSGGARRWLKSQGTRPIVCFWLLLFLVSSLFVCGTASWWWSSANAWQITRHSHTTRTYQVQAHHQYYSDSESESALNGTTTMGAAARQEIPNLVHFVYLVDDGWLRDDHDDHANIEWPPLSLQFEDFLAVYAAHVHLRPDRILIHTNLPPAQIRATLRHPLPANQTDPHFWTARVLQQIPRVELRHTDAAATHAKSMRIRSIVNRSDFVRTRVLSHMGGIYLDFDAYVLKDMQPLRRAGFANIVARQADGRIGCGMLMGTAGSRLLRAYEAYMPRAYDGRWDTHAVGLLDALVHAFAPQDPLEVLVLEQHAFFPLSWRDRDLRRLYLSDAHADTISWAVWENETAVASPAPSTPRDPLATSWAVHGFRSALKRAPWWRQRRLDVAYFLGSLSPFAKALRPIVQRAVQELHLSSA